MLLWHAYAKELSGVMIAGTTHKVRDGKGNYWSLVTPKAVESSELPKGKAVAIECFVNGVKAYNAQNLLDAQNRQFPSVIRGIKMAVGQYTSLQRTVEDAREKKRADQVARLTPQVESAFSVMEEGLRRLDELAEDRDIAISELKQSRRMIFQTTIPAIERFCNDQIPLQILSGTEPQSAYPPLKYPPEVKAAREIVKNARVPVS